MQLSEMERYRRSLLPKWIRFLVGISSSPSSRYLWALHLV